MDITQESEADALWQDSLDLLSGEGKPEAFLAMLRSCTPTSLENGVLRVETPMRIVVKKVAASQEELEEMLSQAAFEPIKLEVALGGAAAAPRPHVSSMSQEEARDWTAATSSAAPAAAAAEHHEARIADDGWQDDPERAARENRRRRERNPLVEDVGAGDSKLTFDRFVRGDENMIAYDSAVQVANGVNKSYGLLFIYGKSGLGKTHLLRAIQNYIAQNDPSRICVYKDASSFISDYVNASRSENKSAADELRQNYADIDVLIVDDVQGLAGKAGTINFFFDTFNTLRASGKWVVLAADRTPAELGMGKDGFDERVTSRIGGGFTASVQVPSYELRVRLIEKFCERAIEDAQRDGLADTVGIISTKTQQFMAEKAGNNIRLIEGFCQRCLIASARAQKNGVELSHDEVLSICSEVWPTSEQKLSIEQVQRGVEKFYDVSHEELIGNKRNKSLMEARHVAVWLCREMCNQTLADIGKKFGGRSHATVMHSLRVVDDTRKDDRTFQDRLMQVRESIVGDS